MPILLDSRNQSRRPESNVKEGIVQQPGPFYNGNPSSSIWGRGSASGEALWTNGSDPSFMDISPCPPPLRTIKPDNLPQPKLFVFGSGDTPSTTVHVNGGENVEQVGDLLNNMNVRSEAASTSGRSSEPDLKAAAAGFVNPFNVGSVAGKQGLNHPQVNPRPRFTKLRKSTHQNKARSQEGGEDKLAEVVDTFRSRFRITPLQDEPPAAASVEEPSVSGTDTEQNVSKAEETTEGEREGEGERGNEKPGSVETLHEEVGKSDVFTFTAMRDSVPTFAKVPDLTEEANSVAASLAALKLPQVSTSSSARTEEPQAEDVPAAEAPRAQDVETDSSVRADAGDSDAKQRPFVFGTNLADGDIRSAFVFSATGYAAAAVKKKDKLRKTSSRIKQSRSTNSLVSEDYGSPMDISPCPQGQNEEEEPSNVPTADIEALQAATAELKLGLETEELNGNVAFEPFSFNSTPSSAKTSQRRPRRPVPKAKPRTRSSILDEQQTEKFVSVPIAPRPFHPDVEQTCESWRLRGNEAYANGDFPKAEECYSLGASSVPDNETSQRCLRALMLCYSNRAATRMAVGRMTDALSDCLHAISLDSNFLRARIRAGSCHLAMGEAERAIVYFKECLAHAGRKDQSDMKIAAEASDGLAKAHQLQECLKNISEHASQDNFSAALRLTNDALVLSPYSETLLEMKARWLLSLQKLDEAIEMCEKTLSQSETNWSSKRCPKYWRSYVKSKALFFLGRLEDSLECVRKLGDAASLSQTDKISEVLGANMQTLSQFTTLLHVLLQHKAAGNEAFQAGRQTEAIEHYTAALTCNSEARPFNAVLFCNRAAAFQALDNIADAIADASRAVVLETRYAKAISRRATLHALIRDYGQACADLRKLTGLLESSTKENARKTNHELKEARDRLANAEEELKKGLPVDHYRVLGLSSGCTAAEVRKAYRKLALRHHPDKAGQVADVLKDAADESRRDADRLFKLIGEAYAVLSDPSKRARYDAEEEMRRGRPRGANAATSSHHQHGSRYERNGRRQRDGWDAWSAYFAQRWQSDQASDYDAAQPDYYGRESRDYQSRKSPDWNGL